MVVVAHEHREEAIAGEQIETVANELAVLARKTSSVAAFDKSRGRSVSPTDKKDAAWQWRLQWRRRKSNTSPLPHDGIIPVGIAAIELLMRPSRSTTSGPDTTNSIRTPDRPGLARRAIEGPDGGATEKKTCLTVFEGRLTLLACSSTCG
jgi:hypothetical protein